MKLVFGLLLLSLFFIWSDGQSSVFVPFPLWTPCYYEGGFYPNWYFLNRHCFYYICIFGHWVFAGINNNCKQCWVYGDPNFKTFDGTFYNWHGLCNYTLAQPYHNCDISASYCPKCAIYSDFSQSLWFRSRLHLSTYKVNPNTIVTIQYSNGLLPSVKLNGIPQSLSLFPSYYNNGLFMWRNLNFCIYMSGSCYSIIACTFGLIHYMYVYTTLWQSVGLCGYYTNNPFEDFLNRFTCTTTSLNPFAISWLTLQQQDDCCASNGHVYIMKPAQNEYLSICAEYADRGFKNCYDTSRYADTISNVTHICAADIGSDIENKEVYLNGTYHFGYQFCQNTNSETSEEDVRGDLPPSEDYPKEYPNPDYPSKEYPSPIYDNPRHPNPDYPSPIYDNPRHPNPDYPSSYPNSDYHSEDYPYPNNPKPIDP